MPVAWFLAPYKRRLGMSRPTRYCAMDDFTPQIVADGGSWAESEGLGDQAVVKVNASIATLNLIDAAPGMLSIPRRWAHLADGFADMTAGERNTIQNRLLGLGFSQAEIDGALGSTLNAWRTHTLMDLLVLITSRRLKPRYDSTLDQIILDGAVQPTRPVTNVDAAIPE